HDITYSPDRNNFHTVSGDHTDLGIRNYPRQLAFPSALSLVDYLCLPPIPPMPALSPQTWRWWPRPRNAAGTFGFIRPLRLYAQPHVSWPPHFSNWAHIYATVVARCSDHHWRCHLVSRPSS